MTCRSASRPPRQRAATEPGKDLEIEMAFASQEPYERWWGIEILDCAPESVRLGRLNDGGALLYNHDWDALRGHHMPGTVRADADRVIRGRVSVSWAADDGKTIRLIEGGHLTKTSTGYEIHRVIEAATAKSGEQIKRTIDGRVFGRVLERCQRDGRGDLAAFRRALDAQAGAFERADDKAGNLSRHRLGAAGKLARHRACRRHRWRRPVGTSGRVGAGQHHHRKHSVKGHQRHERSTSRGARRTCRNGRAKIDVAAIRARCYRQGTGPHQRDQCHRRTAQGLRRCRNGPRGHRIRHAGHRVPEACQQTPLRRGNKWAPEIGMSQGEAKRFSVVKASARHDERRLVECGAGARGFGLRRARRKAGIQRQAENSFSCRWKRNAAT